MVDPAVAPHRGQHAERHADHDREHEGDRRELDRRRRVLRDVGEHRALARDRDAEIAVHELGEEDPVLLPERQIEAPLGAVGGDQRLVGRLHVAELGEDRVGRHQARDEEDDEGGEHDHHDHAQHPRHEVAQQAATAPAESACRQAQEAGLILAISTCQPAAVSSKSSIELRVAIR